MLSNEVAAFEKLANDLYQLREVEINHQKEINKNKYFETVDAEFSDSQYLNNNHNHLWSWFSGDTTHPLIVTKLGISVDWQTLLDEYHPISGRYGLRILISGSTRPTEDEPSAEITEEVFFTNDEMYGNTYGFYEPYVQEKIFDISKFLTLSQINVFFWQDHNFKDQYGVLIPYKYTEDELKVLGYVSGEETHVVENGEETTNTNTDTNNDDTGSDTDAPTPVEDTAPKDGETPTEGPIEEQEPATDSMPEPRKNIVVSDISVYLGLTLDECKTDRIFLWTYDAIDYAADPAMINGYEKTTRDLKMAWVHITPDGPILVDHYAKDFRGDQDKNSFEYWNATIHWYHYELNCSQDANKLYERQGGLNWKHITHEKEELVYDSETGQEVSGMVDDYTYTEYVVTPDVLKAKDQWKVGVMLDNHMYTSAPLVFTNADKTVETAAIDSINEVVFRLLRQTPGETYQKKASEFSHNESLFGLSSYDIVEDNTLSNFYVYDKNGKVLKNVDNVYYSDIWYYIQIWIRNNDTGEYLPMTYDPNNGLDQVEWNFPQEQLSMIAQWDHCTEAELKGLLIGNLSPDDTKDYLIQLDNITRRFRINSNWILARNNNTISARVTRKKYNKVYYPTKLLEFGENGTMGSDYTIIFSLMTNGNALIKGEEFKIAAMLKNRNGEEERSEHYLWTWKLLSPTIITASKDEDITVAEDSQVEMTPQEAWTKYYNSRKEADQNSYSSVGYYGNVLTGYIRNDNPPIFEVTVSGAAGYDITAVKGFRLTSSANQAKNLLVNCADRVEFKSDGSAPIAETGYFSVMQTGTEDLASYIYPQWKLTQYFLDGNTWKQLPEPDYFGLHKSVWPQQNLDTNYNPKIYYFTEPNSEEINFDTLSLVQQEGQTFSTFLELRNAINQELQVNVRNMINNTNNSDVESLNQQMEQLEAIAQEKLNKLYQAGGVAIESHEQYSFDPYIRRLSSNETQTTNSMGNSILSTDRSTWMWDDDFKNYYTYIGFGSDEIIEESNDGDNPPRVTQVEYYRQAIPFTQNVYSSSLLDSWDGSYYFDEADGYLASQVISAGTKDSQNTFTGVLMGNWYNFSDKSLSIPGIYGMNKGKQTFGFKTDGTGFIGADAHGRIEFDGNQALISNSDKSCYINLDPITYTYQNDGKIALNHYIGAKYPYFLYAEAKKTSGMTSDTFDELEMSTAWVSKYMQDSSKDYFIVDTNNGILTTGGIISRYGKIGNWIISSQGLYQRHVDSNNLLNNRFMQLGYPAKTLQQTLEEHEEWATLKANIEQRKTIARQDIINNLKIKELEYIRTIYTGPMSDAYTIDPLHYYNDGWAMLWCYEIIQNAIDLYTQNNVSEEDTENRMRYMKQAIFDYYAQPLPHTGYHYHYKPKSIQYVNAAYTLNQIITGVSVSDMDRNVTNEAQSGPNYLTIKAAGNDPLLLSGYEHGNGVKGFDWACQSTSSTNASNFNPVNSYYGDIYHYPENQGDVSQFSDEKIAEIRQSMANESWLGQCTYKNVTVFAETPQWEIWCNKVGLSPVQRMQGINVNNASTLTDAHLHELSLFLQAGYGYSNEAYNRMLTETIRKLIETNPELKAEYENYVQTILEVEKQKLEVELENRFSRMQAILDAYRDEIEAKYYKDDNNRFAIWCGYDPPNQGGYPLFSVNWRGFMTAREALIGYHNPWLVTDYGLTQTNNFGTIFLGNPEAPYNISRWVTGASDNIITFNAERNTLIVQTDEKNENDIIKTMELYSLKNESDISFYNLDVRTYNRIVIIAKIANLINNQLTTNHYNNINYVNPYNINVLNQLSISEAESVLAILQDYLTFFNTSKDQLTFYDDQTEDQKQQIKDFFDNFYDLIQLGIDEINGTSEQIGVLTIWYHGGQNNDIIINETLVNSIISETTSESQRMVDIGNVNSNINRINTAITTANTTINNINTTLDYYNANLIYYNQNQIKNNVQNINQFPPLYYWYPESTITIIDGALSNLQEIQNCELIPGTFKNELIQTMPITSYSFNSETLLQEMNDLGIYEGQLADINWEQIYYNCVAAAKKQLLNMNLGPYVYNTFGNFALQAGNIKDEQNYCDRQIHFGVRLDGTLFSDRGKIGGWRITDSMLVNYKDDIEVTVNQGIATPSTGIEYIALDSVNNQIRLANHQIVIDGKDGIIYIGKYGNDITSGEIQLATHRIVGDSAGEISYQNFVGKEQDLTYNNSFNYSDLMLTSLSNDLAIYYDIQGSSGGQFTSSVTYKILKLNPVTDSNGNVITYNYTGNRFRIIETINGKDAGIILSNMRQTIDQVQQGDAITYFYPSSTTDGWLGTNTNKWNIYSQKIIADKDSIWMDNCLVATQDWVANVCNKIGANVGALDQAVSRAFGQVNSALNKLMKLIKGDWSKPGSNENGQWTENDASDRFNIDAYLFPIKTTVEVNMENLSKITIPITFNSQTANCEITVSKFNEAVDARFEEGWKGLTPTVVQNGNVLEFSVKSPKGYEIKTSGTIGWSGTEVTYLDSDNQPQTAYTGISVSWTSTQTQEQE